MSKLAQYQRFRQELGLLLAQNTKAMGLYLVFC